MGLGFSIFLIAAGALMRYAVTADAEGFNIHSAGMILMVVGAIGAVLSLIAWGMPGTRRTRRERTVDTPHGPVTEVERTQSSF